MLVSGAGTRDEPLLVGLEGESELMICMVDNRRNLGLFFYGCLSSLPWVLHAFFYLYNR